MHGFYEKIPPNPYLFRYPMEKRPPSRNQEEIDLLFSSWKWILSRVEQNELARLYGFSPRQAGTEASPPRPPKDTRARGSRATKNAPQRRSYRTAPSRRSAPTTAAALPPDRRRRPSKPDASEELSDKTQVVPQAHRRQRRTHHKERESRRLRKQLPEFGLLGETQSFHNASLARNGRLSKKPAAKGAKP